MRPDPRVVRRPMLLAMLGIAVSCAPFTQQPTRPGFGTPHDPVRGEALPAGVRQPSRSEESTTRRRVAAKEDPATLVANDASRCVVPEDRYRNVKVGDRVTCAWRSADRAQ